jgi:hypothetical protein
MRGGPAGMAVCSRYLLPIGERPRESLEGQEASSVCAAPWSAPEWGPVAGARRLIFGLAVQADLEVVRN